jgi:hypothetical protein
MNADGGKGENFTTKNAKGINGLNNEGAKLDLENASSYQPDFISRVDAA